ncbi:MerR family transcriptional regulator [Bifidobacterium tissieri]|uniref:MerR family transcriptional regulator n=2 Tax=Bifidobacterium tissieri TaxID=1630162 RepID=A0A5M9ZIE4_9BIFI|nr:MerR family transcriptional regulator [Bifidobacterium tissieri]KAA8827374.1 MerR family transcriptional regulator [Bifidobacterium tissieri]KAA8830552.1 MerR family transcriptional regulator [Bifidobacterium tissieri]
MIEDSTVRLSLHVPSRGRMKPRKPLPHAIQGQLFAMGESPRRLRGYQGTSASKVAGITRRQLDYLARRHVVEPSIRIAHGSGVRGLYTVDDVVRLVVFQNMLNAGVNLQVVIAVMHCLARHTTEELKDITILCDDDTVYECVTDDQVVRLIRDGRMVVGASVGAVYRYVNDELKNEKYVDVEDDDKHASDMTLDEFTEVRLRRQYDQQGEVLRQQKRRGKGREEA